MRLTSKFVLIYLAVTLVVLSIGGYVSYFIIKGEIDKELKWRFLDRVKRVTYLLEQGHHFDYEDAGSDNHTHNHLTITQLPAKVEPSVQVRDTMVWDKRLQQRETNLKLIAIRNVNGQSYRIATHGALVETDDITEAVTKILLWILGMQVIGAIGVGLIVSNRLFKPFRKTLAQIKNFSLQNKQPIEAENTNVKEFNDLNTFVEEMTHKAVGDYRNLKEFAENASHELQTPLSVVKGKLELLTETDLSPKQYQLVEGSQRSIKKLSKLSESLALLTKIENHEFTDTEEVNMTQLIKESTTMFEEFITLNGLSVETELETDVTIRIHSVLADILWTNLFQNAIKHNVEGGHIHITLTQEKLIIKNTGPEPDHPLEELFGRFKKADTSSSSIGLGLSIVKRIIDQNNFDIAYAYLNQEHIIKIDFS
ncbi:sensor histidine kinase [Fodinibius halophilus]|uniref:histidine kinase n=1 Tax=Fodinibius halophilus TaxID=1736908 RepID=A0A6M1T892_9BACT|nr:HAMP domain-containing sensor histidine kinase [Fodinibius halophilus]NGP88833.1 HAMP domain-containing histidine kinase [Fodinibius halophilus]